MKLGGPIRISAKESHVLACENVEEINDFFGGESPLVCSFAYGELGLSIYVKNIISDRSWGCSSGQNPRSLLLLYELLISSGHYQASKEQQRNDLVDLFIQIEAAVSSDEPIVAWRAWRDRSLVKKWLARIQF
jgi:hypothetical protein